MWDEKDKLRKEKDELRDEYYGGLITFSKYKYLIQDIEWMTDMQGKIKAKNEEREKREQERKERQERIQKEREEKKKMEEERRQREVDRKAKAIENKKQMEEQLVQTEIDGLARLQKAIDDEAVHTNPLYDEIEACENLKKFIQKKINSASNEAPEETKEETTEAAKQKATDIDKLQKKGQLERAATKEEKLAGSIFLQMKSNKGKKKKLTSAAAPSNSVIEYPTIKKFNDLKITAPLTEDDFERAIKDLDELIASLLYWGNIIQRQNKIRFIKNARKISSDEEYTKQAEDEEKYIEGEKAKFECDDTSDLKFSQEMLKIAQTLDREKRMKRAWNEEDEDEEDNEDEEDDDRGFTAEDMGDEENPKAYTPKPQKGSRGRGATQDGVTPEGGFKKKPKNAPK